MSLEICLQEYLSLRDKITSFLCFHRILRSTCFVLTSGPKEVKVLVDLAMISAQGRGDLEVQRVSCLHAAATGYAPLIYDIRTDMGFKEFLPLCQAVWKALEVDCELPMKFVRFKNCLIFIVFFP